VIGLFIGLCIGALALDAWWQYRVRKAARLGVRLIIGYEEFSIVEVKNRAK
jgi:hypothetical protein